MKKHVFVMTRYSVLTQVNNAWVIGRGNDFDSYRDELFSNDRLSLHEKLFKEVTLPSLAKLDANNTTALIFTSDELPSKYLNNLISLTSNYSNIKVITLPRDGKVIRQMNNHLGKELEKFNQDVCYATVRLDDDDALADSYFSDVIKYVIPALKGHAITFSFGYNGVYDKGKYVVFSPRKTPKVAIGLTYIEVFKFKGKLPSNPSVYSLGNHSKIDEKVPVIVNSIKPMYIRTIHEESDFYSNELKNKAAGGVSVNLSAVKAYFSSLPYN